MTTRQDNPFAGVEAPAADPLDIALDAVATVRLAGAVLGHDDNMIRLQGEVHGVGAQGSAAARLAAAMAVVSLAVDVRRIADALAPHMGPE